MLYLIRTSPQLFQYSFKRPILPFKAFPYLGQYKTLALLIYHYFFLTGKQTSVTNSSGLSVWLGLT